MSDLDPRDYYSVSRDSQGTYSAWTHPCGCCSTWNDELSDDDIAAILSDLVRRHSEYVSQYARMLGELRA